MYVKSRHYDNVELTDARLDSDDNDAISSFAERRRDEAVAVSNCCLVCWCIILHRSSALCVT